MVKFYVSFPKNRIGISVAVNIHGVEADVVTRFYHVQRSIPVNIWSVWVGVVRQKRSDCEGEEDRWAGDGPRERVERDDNDDGKLWADKTVKKRETDVPEREIQVRKTES